MPLLALMLFLTPYDGPILANAAADTAKFAVKLHGKPNQTVRLRAVHVPPGYIASFCTSRVCAPFSVSLRLPQSGSDRIELALIESGPAAHRPRIVTVTANESIAASIRFSKATH